MMKAIFFDIDGTLLSYKSGRVPESTINSLLSLKAKGIKIFIATGRHLSEMTELPDIFDEFDGYITLNGQICLDENKNFLYGEPFSPEISEDLVALFNEKKYPLALVDEENYSINFLNETVYKAHSLVVIDVPKVGLSLSSPIYQAICYVGEELDEELRSRLPKGCTLTRWNPYGADIISVNGGKSVGIKYFQSRFGFSTDEIMAFGDADNDIDMLRFAGIGVALGNAKENVKAYADYVTTDIDEDGIYKALVHFGIL